MNCNNADTETVKMEQDFSTECDAKIPEAEKIAKTGNLSKAIEELIGLEKQTRVNGDMISTGRILVSIVQMCFEAKNWPLLNENINLFAKRRGQLKGAVVKMVQEVQTYIDQLPDKKLKYELIDTLRSVTEGKIYVEVERARLTYKLAKMREAEGDIALAGTILQELQVETYGSMERREKVELILEQMRYCLAKNDYIRTQIISKKINVKFFEDESTHDLKLKFYNSMVEMDQHEGNYLNICRHYRAILTTPGIQKNEVDKKNYTQCAVLYLLLSPYGNEQSDLLHRMLEDKALEQLPIYKTLLELFKNQELINWKEVCKLYEHELKAGSGATAVFDKSEFGVKRWQTFKNRVVEHNIRIMAKYYTRVSLTRMSELLDLSKEEVETCLCGMIVGSTVVGRIDRPSGIVSFLSSKDPSESLNDWARNLSKLMSLISRTTHLINKEEMVHKHLLGGGGNKPSTSKPSTTTAVSSAPTPMEVD